MVGLRRLLRRRRIPTRVALLLSALVAVVTLATATTYAAWVGTTSVDNNQLTTGTVTIVLGATGAATNRLDVNVAGITPGDTVERSVDLANTGTLDLASVTLTTMATVSSVLDTDPAQGLQMQIDRCSVPWTETGAAPDFSYTCGGTTSSVLGSQAIIGTNLALGNLASTTVGNTDHLLVSITLPTASGNAFQGKSSTLRYTFTGTQRAGSTP